MYFLLLLFSSTISFVSLYSPYKWITIIGIVLTFAIASINKWKNYKSLQDLDKKISGYDNAFQTGRDSDGNIKKINIDGGTY